MCMLPLYLHVNQKSDGDDDDDDGDDDGPYTGSKINSVYPLYRSVK